MLKQNPKSSLPGFACYGGDDDLVLNEIESILDNSKM